jgi:hypothetical protein
MNFNPDGQWFPVILAITVIAGIGISLLLLWYPLPILILVCMVAIVLGIVQNEDYWDYDHELGLLSLL